jgi:hypothetical protein
MRAILMTACGCTRLIDVERASRELVIPIPFPEPIAADPITFLARQEEFHASGRDRRIFELQDTVTFLFYTEKL